MRELCHFCSRHIVSCQGVGFGLVHAVRDSFDRRLRAYRTVFHREETEVRHRPARALYIWEELVVLNRKPSVINSNDRRKDINDAFTFSTISAYAV